MNAQPEALRLAGRLDLWGDQGDLLEAAAELRRLAKVEDEWAALSQDQGKLESQIDRLVAQRDALLEALKDIAGTDPVDAALDPQRAVRIARAAIAKAEGESNG